MPTMTADLAAPEVIAKYEPVIGLEVHVQLGTYAPQDFLRLRDEFWGGSEYECVSGLSGAARRFAGVVSRGG